MLDLSALRDIRPFIATPSHSGELTTAYVRSLLALSNSAWQCGFAMQTRFLDGDSLITRARNRLVAEFMADPRWTHLFWIDADIGFEPEAALRLLRAGRPVVAGVYPHKADGWPDGGLPQPLPAGARRMDVDAAFAVYPVHPMSDPRAIDQDGFLEVRDAPTGFMLIERVVFERIAHANPELAYVPDASAGDNRHLPHYRFFDVMVEHGQRYLSEDFAFCRRWQALGGQVFVDVHSNLEHVGRHTYRGRFASALRAAGG